jgi:hypothetical protein
MSDEPSKPYAVTRVSPDYLDGSMTRGELATALEEMRFPRRGGTKPLEIDADVRNYLLGLLRRP